MDFGDRVKIARKRKKVTQQQLADIAGLSKSTLANIESSHYSTNLTSALCIADALGVSMDWLAGRTEDPYAHKRYKPKFDDLGGPAKHGDQKR